MEANKYHVTACLQDGAPIVVRAINPRDGDSLRQQFVHLSAESVRLRFHGLRRSPNESEVMHLTEVDFAEHVALVATLGVRPEQLIGVGRYICGHGPRDHRAEVAFVVLDEYQGKGVGSILLQHLAIIGRAQGLREFQADVLAENSRMLGVFERSGFPITRATELGVVTVLLTIAGAPAA